MQQKLLCGLIESDWNLKPVTVETVAVRMPGINRIRLEFKVLCISQLLLGSYWINRIRLEFKVALSRTSLLASSRD